MTKLAPMVAILLTVVGIWLVICYSPIGVTSDYSTEISVDRPDRIENAISNVVSDLRKRDFVPVHLEVNWHPAGKTYKVHAKGIDRIKLRSLVGNVQEN
jgi:hypothetical protein